MEWVPVFLIVFKVIVLGTGMFFSIKWHHDQDKKKQAEEAARQENAESPLEGSD